MCSIYHHDYEKQSFVIGLRYVYCKLKLCMDMETLKQQQKRKKNKTNQSMVNEHKYKETQWYDFHYNMHQITSHRCSVKLWLSANWTNGLNHVCAK